MIPIIALISVAFASNAIIASAQDGSICPSELAFVCGVDGKNYSNECVAIGNGIIDFSYGLCPDSSHPQPCSAVGDAPVCDAVDETYRNQCLAEMDEILERKEREIVY
jgi:hypothetical protein